MFTPGGTIVPTGSLWLPQGALVLGDDRYMQKAKHWPFYGEAELSPPCPFKEPGQNRAGCYKVGVRPG